MKMGFHFMRASHREELGMLCYVKGHVGCLSCHLCAHTSLGEHSHPLVHSAASGTRSHWAGLTGKVQIWAHPGWSRQHHWEGAVCKSLRLCKGIWLKWCRICPVNIDDLQEQDVPGIQLLQKRGWNDSALTHCHSCWLVYDSLVQLNTFKTILLGSQLCLTWVF